MQEVEQHEVLPVVVAVQCVVDGVVGAPHDRLGITYAEKETKRT